MHSLGVWREGVAAALARVLAPSCSHFPLRSQALHHLYNSKFALHLL